MLAVWSSLAPLALGSAIVPVQIIITILLLRSSSGRLTSVAWVLGMTVVRLLQGAIFGLALSSGDAGSNETGSSSPAFVSGILLVVSVLLLATGIKQLVSDVDPDAPPPKWLTATETMTPTKAFLLGGGVLLIGAKFWVFTLGAISVIGEADLGRTDSIVTYLLFVLAASAVNVLILGAAFLMPTRSAAWLSSASGWLTKHNRVIMIVVSLVFGTWFLLKALSGLGII
jgi:hypothetical protein